LSVMGLILVYYILELRLSLVCSMPVSDETELSLLNAISVEAELVLVYASVQRLILGCSMLSELRDWSWSWSTLYCQS
jgi:hypothetical protein